MKIANGSFEYVSQFKYLRMIVINQNLIWEEIKGKLNSCNAPYNSVQELLSCCLLSKKHRLKVSQNKVLRRIFEPKRGKEMEWWRKLHDEELHNLHSSPRIIRIIKFRMQYVGHVA
jgi:hypothetical protein